MALKVWNNDNKESNRKVLLKGTCVFTERRRVNLDWGELEVKMSNSSSSSREVDSPREQVEDSSLQAPREGSSGWSLESSSSSLLPCVPRKCAIPSFPCEVEQDTHLLCAGPSV